MATPEQVAHVNPDEAQQVADFMRQADEQWLDTVVEVRRAPDADLEQLTIYDAVNARETQADGSVITTPVVQLVGPDGPFYSTVAELLEWRRNADPEPVIDEVEYHVPTPGEAREVQTPEQAEDANVAEPDIEASAGPVADTPVEVAEQQVSDSDAETMAARHEINLAVAVERLGLPSDATLEMVEQTLTQKVNDLQVLVETLSDFEPSRRLVIRGINDTFSAQKNLLTGAARDGLESYLVGPFKNLEQITRETHQGGKLLSGGLAKDLKALSRSITSLRGDTDAMVARGRTFIDTDAAQRVKRTLEQFPRFAPHVAAELHEATDMLARVSGFAKSQTAYEQGAHTKELSYRDKTVEAWAKELSSPNLSPERLRVIESEMFNAVGVEAGMVDDPNSPQVWFDKAVVNNLMKSRGEGVPFSGRPNGNIPSQQHVAELMSDMLTGKYNIKEGGTLSPIILRDENAPAHNKVTSGVHRAAALAMLYGNEWPKVAAKQGIRIEKAA